MSNGQDLQGAGLHAECWWCFPNCFHILYAIGIHRALSTGLSGAYSGEWVKKKGLSYSLQLLSKTTSCVN